MEVTLFLMYLIPIFHSFYYLATSSLTSLYISSRVSCIISLNSLYLLSFSHLNLSLLISLNLFSFNYLNSLYLLPFTFSLSQFTLLTFTLQIHFIFLNPLYFSKRFLFSIFIFKFISCLSVRFITFLSVRFISLSVHFIFFYRIH